MRCDYFVDWIMHCVCFNDEDDRCEVVNEKYRICDLIAFMQNTWNVNST
jgi:hypothetical protein